MRAALALVLGFGLGLPCRPARADDITLPRTKAVLHVSTGWHAAAAAQGLVTAFRRDDGAVLALTRADVPNPDAWRTATRSGYADRVERGLAAAVPGWKRTAKKLSEAEGGIPALDLEATRDGGATLVVRVLLFRTYALALAIEVPRGGDVADARAITTSLAPPRPAAP